MHQYTPRRRNLLFFAIGSVIACIAIYSYSGTPSPNGKYGNSTSENSLSKKAPSSRNYFSPPATDARALTSENPLPSQDEGIFSADEIASRVKEYFERLVSDPSLSDAQRSAFAARLVASIEADPKAKLAVSDYLSKMPDDMLRDELGNMLVLNATGREMLVTEANRIWQSKDKTLYRGMYMTYANMPGTASPNILADAISSLGERSNSDYPSISALNFIGTLEQDTSIEGAALRQSALSQLESLIRGDGDDTVRAIAAQKVYRLSSPEAAAEAATNYLSHNPSNPLVMETLNSVRSGDVELTPPLRSKLAAAVSRPQASQSEIQSFAALTKARGS
ncbi:hypothetical protein VC273_08040 [Xanthomonas nasturtii]|uniref:hypothetical protein n=1 Tax=Xanthomonas TaxID=338 RepID=UPI002B222BA8|nr:hypothetical protein [Xanthomonas nasturtii]MEA9555873.1 hypothetical protein [Xanthomonas nasturtii]